VAIRTFRRREVGDFFFDGKLPGREGWAQIATVAARKLDMLHYPTGWTTSGRHPQTAWRR
jgi:hypothetical protein